MHTIVDHKKILSLLQKRDPKAIEIMYDLFAPMLYGIALKIVKNESGAEDLLQETLLHFYKNYSSFDDSKQNISLWLIGILQSIAKNKTPIVTKIQNQQSLFYVDTGKSKKLSDGTLLFQKSNDNTSAVEIDQKNILDLVLLEGKKINELSKMMGMEESKIKKILRDAVNIKRQESGTWK